MNIDKNTIRFWLIVLVIGICIFYAELGGSHFGCRGFATINRHYIVMTTTQRDITNQTFDSVINDIDSGIITTTEQACEAVYGNIPLSVRTEVMDELGTPEFDKFTTKLNQIRNRIQVK